MSVAARLRHVIVKWAFATLIACSCVIPTSQASSTQVGAVQREPKDTSGRAQRLRVEVEAVFPHDRGAFTEGLVLSDGSLYESTGLNGSSSLRQVNLGTGQVERVVALEPALFGEGLAQVGDRLIQLTWREGLARIYDRASFERIGEFAYSGEGWGLCYDGQRLVMSDGSATLFFRDPDGFEIVGSVRVTLDGEPINQLNELECVGDQVYANVWLTDLIVRIDAVSGQVDAVIDASGLLTRDERPGTDVLNGIAYDPEKDDFLITGKFWPYLYEVRFVP
ncbi:MAG: glutaminyl-peptide cyclotransferase [Chloroflexi bacterium]|nr:glutaminyl-peptide cyclotransferase [Chloroflexota bacterium]